MTDLLASGALYRFLYGLTLVLHVVFLAYVLAGSAYVAFAAARASFGAPKSGPSAAPSADPVAAVLREWLPFGLGAAITAGVAPLLFLQMVRKTAFYSANLLLSHRWMVMLPALMGGFYLLYLAKSDAIVRRGPRARFLVAALAFSAFAVVGYTWTENHLVSQRAAEWPALYASARMFFGDAESLFRFLVWLFGAFPIMATLVGWQIHARVRTDLAAPNEAEHAARTLARVALLGIGGSVIAALGYVAVLPPVVSANLAKAPPMMELALLALALVGTVVVFARAAVGRALEGASLTALSIAGFAAITANVVLRDALSSARDQPVVSSAHAQSGGVLAFAFFFLLNAALIAWCVRAVSRAVTPQPDRGRTAP